MSTALRQRETRTCMPSMYQLVSSSRSHVLTFLQFLKPQLSAPSVQRCSYRLQNLHTQHTTVFECSPHFLSPPLRIQLQLVVCNVWQTQTPFSQITTLVLSVGRPCTYKRAQWTSVLLPLNFHIAIFILEMRKMWGITFWATFLNGSVSVSLEMCTFTQQPWQMTSQITHFTWTLAEGGGGGI
jgi:hypothetical protein